MRDIISGYQPARTLSQLPRPFVHANIVSRRGIPGVVLQHAISHENSPRVLVAKGRERRLNGLEQSRDCFGVADPSQQLSGEGALPPFLRFSEPGGVVLDQAEAIARRLGWDRRRFLQSAGGVAAMLTAFNVAACPST